MSNREVELGLELEKAFSRIWALEERLRGADALVVLWETRATRAEAEIVRLNSVIEKMLDAGQVVRCPQIGSGGICYEDECCLHGCKYITRRVSK